MAFSYRSATSGFFHFTAMTLRLEVPPAIGLDMLPALTEHSTWPCCIFSSSITELSPVKIVNLVLTCFSPTGRITEGMGKQDDFLSWAPTDEEDLLLALEIYGLGRWEEVAKRTRCKTASEAERFFKERYPIAPTNSTTLSPEYFLEDIDFNVTDASLFTARWGVDLRGCRKHGRAHELEVRVPDSWAPADVKIFEDHRSYFGEDVIVEKLYWCIGGKIGNKLVQAVIPVWEIPAGQSP